MQNEEYLYISGGHPDHSLAPCNYFMRYCLKSGKWERLPNMIRAKKGHKSVLLGDSIFVISNEFGSEKFSTSAKVWSEIAPFPSQNLTSVVAHQGVIIGVESSMNSHNVYEYCPQNDQWTHLKELSTKLGKLYHVLDTAVSYNGELWFYGRANKTTYGLDIENRLSSNFLRRYDFENKTLVQSESFGEAVDNQFKKNLVEVERYFDYHDKTVEFLSNEDIIFVNPSGVKFSTKVESNSHNFLGSIFYSALTGWNSVLPMKNLKPVHTCLVKHNKIFAFLNCIEGNVLFKVYDIEKGLWTEEVNKIIPLHEYAVC